MAAEKSQTSDRTKCGHPGCEQKLPPGNQIPVGWTVARVEKFGVKKVKLYYIYICPAHVLTTSSRQEDLFSGAARCTSENSST